MLQQLFIDHPLQAGPIQVWPIAGRLGHTRYNVPGLTGDLHFRELDVPDVGRIELHNVGGLPLVVPSGWLVNGLRQSRMVVPDVLIPAAASVDVEVACVEAGRWRDSYGSRNAGRAPVSVMVAAQDQPGATETGPTHHDLRQSRVWSKVRAYERRTGSRPTSSLPQIMAEDIRRSRSVTALSSAIDSLDFPHGATGYVVALGPRPALIEIWSRPEHVAYMLRHLLLGLLLDLPDFEAGPPPRRGVVDTFINQVRVAKTSELPSTGSGCQFALGHQRLVGGGLMTEDGEFLRMTAMSREFFDLAV